MKNYTHICLGLTLVLLLVSCNTEKSDSTNLKSSGKNNESSVKLEVVDQLVLSLDSTASPETHMLQYLEYGGGFRLAYLNRPDKTIRLFDIESGEQKDELTFDREGPNRVLNIFGFSIHNEDSIFLTDGYQTNYLVNSSSKLINKYRVDDASLLKHAPGPWVLTRSPMIYDNGKLYYQGYVGGVFDQPNMVSLDLKNNSIGYFNRYPNFYQEAYWRGGFEYMYYTYNQRQRKFVFSFVADHNVQSLSIDDLSNIEVHPADGSEFGKLKPPRLKMGDPGGDQDERKFMVQDSYGGIYYDPTNDLYYRLAYKGIPESDFDSGDPLRSTIKTPRIIILDGQLNKVGEHKLERFKYELNMAFLGDKGLYVKLVDDVNEDIVTFDIFSPVKQ